MKTVIRTSCEETELEWPDRRLFCLLLWDRWLRRRLLLKSGSRRAVAAKVTPSPHPGHGAYKGTLWDPLAKIAGALVAGNSNLKLGDTPVLPVVRWQHLIPGTAVDPGPRVPPRIV